MPDSVSCQEFVCPEHSKEIRTEPIEISVAVAWTLLKPLPQEHTRSQCMMLVTPVIGSGENS